AVPPDERAVVLADAHADLLDLLDAEGLGDRLLLTELHNEVQAGHLVAGLGTAPGADSVAALTPRLEAGIARFRERHPDRPVTVNYSRVPYDAMSALPRDLDALVVHPYVQGPLGDLVETYGLRGPVEEFVNDRARELHGRGVRQRPCARAAAARRAGPRRLAAARREGVEAAGDDRRRAGDVRPRLVRPRRLGPPSLRPLGRLPAHDPRPARDVGRGGRRRGGRAGHPGRARRGLRGLHTAARGLRGGSR